MDVKVDVAGCAGDRADTPVAHVAPIAFVTCATGSTGPWPLIIHATDEETLR